MLGENLLGVTVCGAVLVSVAGSRIADCFCFCFSVVSKFLFLCSVVARAHMLEGTRATGTGTKLVLVLGLGVIFKKNLMI